MGATDSLRRTSTLLARSAAARSFRGLPAGLAASLRSTLRWLAHSDLRSILQLVESIDRHRVSGVNSLDLRHRSVGRAQCDGMDGGRLVRTDYIDECPLGVSLNCGSRNQRDVMKCID